MSDHELVIQRTFETPRERVYRAFTDPDEFERWFAPAGITAEVQALEPEPGGAFAVSWTESIASITRGPTSRWSRTNASSRPNRRQTENSVSPRSSELSTAERR